MNLATAIPIYNQPHYLKDCLTSLRNQISFQSNIFLFDDASALEYQTIISSFSDLNISYKRNLSNLGAMRNMEYSFNEVRSKNDYDYLMILHEDDVLSPIYFKSIENICELSKIKPSLVLSFFSENFKDNNCEQVSLDNDLAYKWVNKIELVKMFLKGEPIAFGSAIYNTEVYTEYKFDFEKYGEFSDRPFLLNHLNDDDTILILTRPLYFLRSHIRSDQRWKLLNSLHVFNLLSLYISILKKEKNSCISYYKKYTTAFIMDSYLNLKLSGKKPNLIVYISMGLLKCQISLKYLLLRNSFINQFFTYLLKSS